MSQGEVPFDLGPFRVTAVVKRSPYEGCWRTFEARRRETGEASWLLLTGLPMERCRSPWPPVELELVRRLDHPYVSRVRGAGADAGTIWLEVDPLPRAPTLMELLGPARDQARRPVEDGLMLMTMIARALAHAHEVGVVARQMTPCAVLVPAGQPPIVTGLAGELLSPAPMRAGPQLLMAAPYFFPPEALEGTWTERSDVYLVGAWAYTWLAGRRPFTGATMAELCRALSEDDPPPATAGRRPQADVVVARAMARDPRERYGSMTELADDLSRLVCGEAVRARPLAPRPLAQPAARPLARPGGLARVLAWIRR